MRPFCNENTLPTSDFQVWADTTPVVSTALQSFMTAGVVATSLAATLISLSYANLGTIETLASGRTNLVASDSSMNLHVRSFGLQYSTDKNKNPCRQV